MPNVNRYAATDKAIDLLNRKSIRRFQAAQSKANLLDFDEANVMRSIRELYALLDADARKAFLELAQLEYERAEPHGKDTPGEDWLEDYLLEYSPVTKYVYAHEVDRKRAYLTEAVIASNTKRMAAASKQQKRSNVSDGKKEFRKALSRWSNMTAQYAIEVTDAVALKAYQDAGVKKVRWVTQHDNRVCDECRARDGKIYPVDQVPPKAHWGDRCYVEPVIE
jgi:SPP1 gp7 family putative phage head morphogenesis protein